MRRFEGKTVVVAGGGRGIGEAAARRFAREGAEVLLVARTAEEVQSAADAIAADGGKAWAHPADRGLRGRPSRPLARAWAHARSRRSSRRRGRAGAGSTC